MNFLKWIRKSFEFRGKASSRKLTMFAAFFLLSLGYLVHLYTGRLIQDTFVWILATLVFLSSGLLTAQNLVDIIKGRFGGATQFIDYEQDIYNNRNRIDNPDGVQDPEK